MKTIIVVLNIALLCSVSRGFAQLSFTNSVATKYATATGRTWLTNYYGKTLSSLGDIVSVNIEAGRSGGVSSTNRQHTMVWWMIERSQMMDYHSRNGIAIGLPPIFTVEYSDGMRVRCDACSAVIALPDGRSGPVLLMFTSPNTEIGGTATTPSR